jgi:hypothetical protein
LRLVEEEVGLSENEHEQANENQGAKDNKQPGPIILVTPNGQAPRAQKGGASGFKGWQGGH